MELKEYKKLAYSEEARKIMEEIKEKAKNSETQIEALELIEQHLDELSMHAFYITLDLSKTEQQKIREKAKGILKNYYEKNPEFEELGKGLDIFKENWEKAFSPVGEIMQTIAAQQRILQKLPLQAIVTQRRMLQHPMIKLGEIAKLYEDWSKQIVKIQKRLQPKIELPKYNIPKEILVPKENPKLALIETKLDEIYKILQELKKSKQLDAEEYKQVKKKIKELDEDVDKAYQ